MYSESSSPSSTETPHIQSPVLDERFRLFVEAMPDAIVMVNREGNIVLVNSQAEKMFGYERRELEDRALENLVPFKDRKQHKIYRDQYFKNPARRAMGEGRELSGLKKCEKGYIEFPIEISLNPFGSYFVAAIRDISERKIYEQQLKEKNQQLEKSNAELESAMRDIGKAEAQLREKAEENVANIKSYTAYLFHELRNPLHSINTLLEDLEETFNRLEELFKQKLAIVQQAKDNIKDLQVCMTNEIQKSLHSIHAILESHADTFSRLEELYKQKLVIVQQAKDNVKDMRVCTTHARNILDYLLDIAKISDASFKLNNRPFDFKAMVKEATTIIKQNAIAKNLIFEVITPVEDLIVNGDSTRIKQIIINLASNAIKFTQKGSVRIFINIINQQADEVEIEIIVQDTGIGINENHIANLFEEFHQISINNQYGGTGLGLIYARKLANKMQGTITVKSKLGEGSTFRCFIQCKKATLEDIKEYSQETPIANNEQFIINTVNRSIKILIAEDNLINFKILNKLLTESGYTCIPAGNGKDAVDKFITDKPDLILMDIEMPEMNGLEATMIIRSIEGERLATDKRGAIPIIGLSGNALSDQAAEAINKGMNAYLTKPYSRKELIDAINKQLHNAHSIIMANVKSKSHSPSPSIKRLPLPKTPTTPLSAPIAIEAKPTDRTTIHTIEEEASPRRLMRQHSQLTLFAPANPPIPVEIMQPQPQHTTKCTPNFKPCVIL